MLDLHWVLGYPFALVLMLVISGSLCLVFKRRSWLCGLEKELQTPAPAERVYSEQ